MVEVKEKIKKDLKKLYDLIADKNTDPLVFFKEFIDCAKFLGPYENAAWDEELCTSVYNLASIIAKIGASPYIDQLNKAISNAGEDNVEFLHFFRLEIRVNTMSVEAQKKYVESLIEEYPANLEFRIALGHCLNAGGDLEGAVKEYEYCVEFNPSEIFKKTLINAHVALFNDCFSMGKAGKVRELLKRVQGKGFYSNDYVYNNVIASVSNRLIDHEIISSRISEGLKEFDSHVEEKMSMERGRVVELLSIFSAVIGFVFGGVTIATSFELLEAMYLVSLLGFVILLFVVSASLIGRAAAVSFKDARVFLVFCCTVGIVLMLMMISLNRR